MTQLIECYTNTSVHMILPKVPTHCVKLHRQANIASMPQKKLQLSLQMGSLSCQWRDCPSPPVTGQS